MLETWCKEFDRRGDSACSELDMGQLRAFAQVSRDTASFTVPTVVARASGVPGADTGEALPRTLLHAERRVLTDGGCAGVGPDPHGSGLV